MQRRQVVGLGLPSFTATVDRGELGAFAAAVGERRPEYHDVGAAHRMGYADLPAPSTYLFALEFRRPQPYLALDVLGAPLSAVLHAEQSFAYDRVCVAGDVLDFVPEIVSYDEKREGTLGFLTRRTTVSCSGRRMATLRNVLAIRWERV